MREYFRRQRANFPGWDAAACCAAAGALWLEGFVCLKLGAHRSTAAILLLLGVLVLSTWRSRFIAVTSAVAATLAFEYFFVQTTGAAEELNMPSRAVMLISMLATALIGSELSLRSQRRAIEAERRRREMEKLHTLAERLFAAQSLTAAASSAARNIVELFGVEGAVLRTPAGVFPCPPEPGQPAGNPSRVTNVPLGHGRGNASLELFGIPPSSEVTDALARLLGLVLERGISIEEQTRSDAVRRGDELRTTILNAVAHDFRTPLTSIKAAASALRASSAAIFEQDRELVEAINEESDRLEIMLRESLALARLETFGQTRNEACSIAAIFVAVKARLARNLDRRRVEADIPEDLPPVAGDPFLLQLMLFQVVENAWKYSAPGGRIVIHAEAGPKFVSVSVWNEGLRIPDYEKDRIFDKFYRGSGGAGGRTEGSGLGLAIARTIAQAHRGSIRLEESDEGTSFRFLLPLSEGVDHVSAEDTFESGREEIDDAPGDEHAGRAAPPDETAHRA